MSDSDAAFTSEYRLIDLVGQGQFAQVYCAIHRQTGQLVALKKTRHAPESSSQEPFILAELNHPNLVCAQAISQTPTGYQFILDYCEGGTLRSHLNTAAPLPLKAIKVLVGDILKGLSYVHDQAIIHGDLKPENILLSYRPAVHISGVKAFPPRLIAKIGDFGSARFIQLPNRSRREIGSPTYAAPERFDGQSSYASDLYSVGVILYELLLGDRPFSGNPDSLRQAHQTQSIPLPKTLTAAARTLLTTALHKRPDQRFKSALAMLSELQQLEQLYADAPSTASPTAPITERLENIAHAFVAEQALTAVSTAGISAPIKQLIALPQGCGVITAQSFHLLTHQKQLLPIAQFENDTWMAPAPTGEWWMALSKQFPWQHRNRNQGQYYRLSSTSSITRQNTRQYNRVLTGSLVTSLQADIIQLLAIDARHLLRIRTSQQAFKTYLECFTRRGQFIGQLSFNLPIVQISLTAIPYQLIARTATAPSSLILISLKPFQIQQLADYSKIESDIQRVNVLSWGYLVSSPQQLLVLDNFGHLVGRLEGLPPARAIASLDDRQLLLATSAPTASAPTANNPSTDRTSADGPSSLWIVDLENLDLGIIF
jgi:serine/threonine protein kinase